MGKILEGFWDCKHCGTKRIKGSIRECPNCGKARDDSTKFYLDETEKHYVSEEKALKLNKNPDWICNFCNQLNSDNDDTCISCGAPRTAENLNYFENKEKRENKNQKKIQNKEIEESFGATSHHENTQNISTSPAMSKKTQSSNKFNSIWKYALIALLIAISFFGIFSLVRPKEYEITVNKLSWERCIDVERYQTVKENDWNLPSGGRLLYTRSEYSHSKQVIDHYETRTRSVAKERISGYEPYVSGTRDLGNGYFEEITSERPIYETYYEDETYQEPVYRTEPVYKTKYYYEIDKWLYERSVKTKGNNNSPYWGKTKLDSDERVSSKSETYTVKGIDNKKDKDISFTLSLDDWSTLEVGQTLKVKITLGKGEIIE